MFDFYDDYYSDKKRLNDTKSYIGITTDSVKNKAKGPGIIYTNSIRSDNKIKFVETYKDGKPHGLYILCDNERKLREVGLIDTGDYVGPCLSFTGDKGYLTSFDSSSNEHGFYVKFISSTEYVIFQFDHGKLKERCLISKLDRIHKGKCTSLDNYWILKDDKSINFKIDLVVLSFYSGNENESFNRPTSTKYYNYYYVEKNGDYVKRYDKKYALIYAEDDKEKWSILKTEKMEMFGEYSWAYKSFRGLCCQRNKDGRSWAGYYGNDGDGSFLMIEPNKGYSLQTINDGKPEHFRFTIYDETLIIECYDKGTLWNKKLVIYKDTFDVGVYTAKDELIEVVRYQEVAVNNTNTVNTKTIVNNVNTINKTSVNTNISNNNVNTSENLNVPIYKKETYSNGYYEGYFLNGKRHGNGTYYWNGNNHLKYVGEWKEDNYHGHGIMYYKDGSRYDGPWINDKMHGEGIWYYPDGKSEIVVYQNGSLISQKKNIQKIDYKNGCWYEGETKNGVCHGQGVYYWSSGDRYEGEFTNGILHGIGIVYFADGTSRKVQYENNVITKSEFNIETVKYSNGYYKGTLKSGTRHGFGTYYWNNGDRYEGNWKDGNYDGKGVFHYADGERFVGYWKDDKKHGEGTYYYKDGTSKKETWNNGKLVTKEEIKEKKIVTKKEPSVKVEKNVTSVSNTKVDIYSNEFKEAMKMFAYKIKENGEVVITSCKNPPKKLVIPEGVTTIYVKAFYNNKPEQIEEVVIANSVEKIQGQAFFKCENLKKLTLGTSLKEIGKWAFVDTKIEEVYIPDSVQKIGEWAFNNEEGILNGKASIPSTCKLGEKAFSTAYTVIIRNK